MKTRKNSKILILVLSLALLIGSVFAITASAAEAETGDLYAVNVYHNDKLAVMFAVKATQAEIQNGTVQVKYTWNDADPTEEVATYLEAHPTKAGYVYVVTTGVAAFALTDTVDFTVYTNGVAGDSGTYSVATYLYNKLYRDAVTGAEKDVYETLVAYGAASQVYFEYNTENMIDAVDYAYTNNSDVKFNGKSYSIGQSTVTATYNGTGIVGAWIINGEEIASSATTYEVTVDGVVSVDVKVTCDHTDANPKDHECDYCGTEMGGACADGDKDHNCDYCGAELSTCADGNNDHNCDVCGTKLSECADATPADHLCDICGDKISLCVDNNNDHNCDICGKLKITACADENKDHACDICGNTTECTDGDLNHSCDICGNVTYCADADGDYRCDACGVISFNTNMTDGQNGVNILHAQSSAGGASASNSQALYAITGADKGSTYTYGTYFSVVNDPTGVADNMVLSINNKSNSGGSGYLSNYIKVTPTAVDANGGLIVLEADFYVDSCTDKKNALHFSAFTNAANAAYGTSISTGYQNITIYKAADGTLTIGGKTVSGVTVQMWVGIKIVLDTVNNKYSVYYSTDSGETFTAVISNASPANTSRLANFADVTSMGVYSDTYGVTNQSYVDNLKVSKLSCLAIKTDSGDVSYGACTEGDVHDHKCDSCGGPAIADEDNNGRCDTCGVATFDVDSITSNNDFVINNIATLGTDAALEGNFSATNTITTDNRPTDFTAGTWLKLATDPTNAANTVLQSNTVTANGQTDDTISDLTLTPTVVVEGGDLIVLDFDYYINGGASGKNLTRFMFGLDDGSYEAAWGISSITQVGVVYGKLVADPDNTNNVISYQTWVKIRLVYDNTNSCYYTFLSTDGGETYVQSAVSKTLEGTGTVTSLGLTWTGWGVSSTQYFDNISCVQTDAATSGITFN